ncbi:hypothetical protein Trydic_g11620 [Trypoxylus dichotomus]
MQLMPNLTLSDCIFYARQAEMQAKQNYILHQSSEINAIQHKKPQSKLTPATVDKCPARNSTCRSCSKHGHWEKVCRKKRSVHNVNQGSPTFREEDHADFIGMISSLSNVNDIDIQKQWLVEVTVSEFNHNTDGKSLDVIGKMYASLPHRKKPYKCLVYVIKDLKLLILGRRGIVNLGIIKHDHNVLTTNAINITSVVNIECEFPLLFQEIGEFKEEIKVNVKEEVKPVALTSPRIVPIPLLPKLQNGLNR